MELNISTKQGLRVLNMLAWVIFIGLCIEAGGILFNSIFTLSFNPIGAKRFWKGIDLFALYQFDKGYYLTEIIIMSIVAILKAFMFYLIIKLHSDKNLSITKPFTEDVKSFISNSSFICFGIALFTMLGAHFTNWLTSKGIEMAPIEKLNFDGADDWFLMAITLIIIAHIVKRGIEIQTENEYTI